MNHVFPLSAICAALFIASCSGKDNKEKTQEETPTIDVAEVVVDSVTTYTDCPAYLTADKSVDLVARVNGYLLSHPYNGGDFVKKGTVLFNIESQLYVDAVNQARASLENAQSAYAYASKNYEAMKRALESDAVSQMEVLQSKNAMETAQAQIASAKAALASAQTTLSYCTVRAPFDGHVSSSPFSDGAYLAGAASPVTLAQIYDDAVVTVNFNINDSELLELIKNTSEVMGLDMKRIPVNFGDTMPHQYYADLSYLAPAIEVSTGQMAVQAHIKNAYGELRPGMIATVRLPTSFNPHAIMVQDAAISKDQLGSFVYVVNDSNVVKKTHIQVGQLASPSMRVVESGLKQGDRYVTKALLKVRDDMKINPHLVK